MSQRRNTQFGEAAISVVSPRSTVSVLTPPDAIRRDVVTPSNLAKEFNLGHVVVLAIKNWRLLLLTTAISMSFSVLLLLSATRKYTAVSRLRIEPYRPVISGDDALTELTTGQEYFATQVETLKSKALIDLVLSDTAVKSKLEQVYPGKFAVEGSGDSQVYAHSSLQMSRYLKFINVTPIPNTTLVKIIAVTEDAELSALLVNTHATKFISLVGDQRDGRRQSQISFLEERDSKIAGKLREAEKVLNTYAEEHKLIKGEDQILKEQVATFQEHLAHALVKRSQMQNRLKRAEQSLANGVLVMEGGEVEKLRSRLSEVRNEIASSLITFTESYPKIKALREREAELVGSIEAYSKNYIQKLKDELELLEKSEADIAKKYQEAREAVLLLAKDQFEYERLANQYDSLRKLQQEIRLQGEKQKLASVARNPEDIYLDELGVVPFAPSSPAPLLFYAVGLLLGLGSGTGLAIFKELSDKSVRSKKEMDELTGLVGLSFIPDFNDMEYAAAGIGEASAYPSVLSSLITLDQPRSPASEEYRALRTAVRLSSADFRMQVLLTASADSGAGRTTVAGNLGVMCALDGSKTLVIDGDLRRAGLSSMFDIPQDHPGLTDYLTGQVELKSVLVPTAISGLYVLPAGVEPPNPSELIGSAKLENLIQTLRERFDYLVIDGPPEGAVSEGLLLSRLADGVLLVVRATKSPKDLVFSSYQRLVGAGAHLLGYVLNGVTMEEFTLLRGGLLNVTDIQEGRSSFKQMYSSLTKIRGRG